MSERVWFPYEVRQEMKFTMRRLERQTEAFSQIMRRIKRPYSQDRIKHIGFAKSCGETIQEQLGIILRLLDQWEENR